MSISSKITSIEEHIGDIYDTLELGGFNPYLLPKEYTQLEYIQSSGTQYIDTGYIPNYDKDIKIEIVCKPTVLNSRYCLLSNYRLNTNHLSLEIMTNQGRIYYNNDSIDRKTGTISTSTINNIVLDYNSTEKQYIFNVNNEIITGAMDATGTSSESMLIFVDQMLRFSTFSSSLQMYNIKITEDETLSRNFIPCKRNSDNEIGLYDLVNNNFATNSGTGTFTAGAENRQKAVNKNIENIAPSIKQKYLDYMNNGTREIWNNWEKVSGTGENVILNNTVQAPMDVTVKGNSKQNGTPSPTNEVPIQNVTGDVEVLVQNKNLAKLDWASKFVTAVNNTNNAKLETKDNKSCVWFKPNVGYNFYDTQNFSLDIKFKPNTQYTVSFDLLKTDANNKTVAIYYTDGTYTSNSNATALNTWEHQSITSTAGKTIAYIAPFYTSGNTYIDINSWQVEENTTATSYVAHEEQTFTFPLGTQRMYLGDYLADDGIHHVRVVMTFDGSENWYDYTPTYEGYYTGYTSKHFGRSGNFEEDILCNYFENLGLGSPNPTLKGTKYATYIKVPNSIATNMTELKIWLGTHNVEVEYLLAEEEITPYTTEQQTAYDEIKQAISYEEQTNISGSSDELEPIFMVVALKNI